MGVVSFFGEGSLDISPDFGPVTAGQPVPFYQLAILALGPAGFWKLDETSGIVAADSSGNARDGVYVNTPVLGGPPLVRTINHSAHFDGVTSTMQVPPNVAFAPGTAFSMMLWKQSIINTANSPLMARGVTGGDIFLIYHNGGTGLWAVIGHAGAYEIADAGVVADDGERHLYGMRWTFGGSVDLLVDGLMVASLPSVLALADPVASPLVMGGAENFFGINFIDADESCGAFLNYAITDRQFADLYAAGV